MELKMLLIAALSCALARGHGQNDGSRTMDVFRLPDNTRPVAYALQFEPDLKNAAFNGTAEIVFWTNSPSKTIVLNQKELNVTDATVRDVRTRRIIAVDRIEHVAKNEQLVLHLRSYTTAQRTFVLTVSYAGKLRTDMTGFYLSSYKENNATKWLAVTQFEPTYARSAFPCYDEPSLKATFNISMVINKNQIALSNMPVSSTRPGINSTIVVDFEKTPPMSTYLVAVFVGDFKSNNTNSSVNVYTHDDYLNQTNYIKVQAPRHLKALEEYTGISYKSMLPKMDLLAIPDFRAGAMENWGINTYREIYLLFDEDSKTKTKMRGSIVVQHEFTHQWFGDLVTCSWWDYTWLNEGFARYFQSFATKTVRPTWRMEELFVVETYQTALAYDQTHRHPITAQVNTPEEIEDIFDTISYSKAAAVLRMLSHLVTEDNFHLSLKTYLDLYRGKATSPDDLYYVFDNVLIDVSYDLGNDLTVFELMRNWTLQSGYPVLYAEKNDTENKFYLTQNRFLVNATDAHKNETALWIIGLTYTTESSKNFITTTPAAWTNTNTSLTVLPAPKNSGWYIFNIQATGFYRVNYPADNWNALIKQLKNAPTAIHVLNRAQLIDDAFALARAGQLDYGVPLNLSTYLKNEDDVVPWYSAMNGFSYLLQRMPRHEQGYADLKAHVSRLVGIIYQKLDDLVAKGNTEYVIVSSWEMFANWACKLDNDACIKAALNWFKKWQNGTKIPADIKDAAFCKGVQNSTGPDTWNRIFDVYTTTKSISEKISAQSALGCSTNKTLLTKYVNYMLDGGDGPIKEQDYYSVISAVSTTPEGLRVLYDFLSTNMNTLLNKTKNGEDIATHIYSVLASKMTRDDDIAEIDKLKNNATLPVSVKTSFEKSFETVNHNMLWFNKSSSVISQWALENREKYEEPTQPPTVSMAPSSTGSVSTSSIAPTVYSPTTTPTPNPSSAPLNAHNSLSVLQTTVLAMFIKKFIL